MPPEDVVPTEMVTPPEPETSPEITPAASQPAVEPVMGGDPKAEVEALRAQLKKVNAESAERRKKLDALEKAEQDRKDKELSEMERLQKQLADRDAELSKLKAEQMRQAAAKRAGLPEAFVSRIQGATPEEMEADAQAMAEALPKPAAQQPVQPKPVEPKILPTNPGQGGSSKLTDDQLRAELWGTNTRGAAFTPEEAQKHGGGVVAVSKNKETTS